MASDLVPRRHSLLSDTTEILRGAILSGKWEGHMPGERALCTQMQVGRDTLRLAIRQLERERIVAPSESGRRRRILAIPDGAADGPTKAGVIVYLTPHRLERLSATALLEVDVLRERLSRAGFRLEVFTTSQPYSLQRPGKSLQRIASSLSADAWILHQTTAPMQHWFFDNGIPCLLHGQPQEEIDLPFVDVDYVAVGRHAGGLLINRGHERVMLLRPHSRLRGLDMAEAGLCSAFANRVGKGLPVPVTVAEPSHSTSVHDLAALLKRQVLGRKPKFTALVLTRTRQVLTVLSWLAQHRLTVPGELSLIALDHSPFLDHLVPEIACYKIDVEKTANTLCRKSLEIAGSGATARSSHPLMPDFIPGASVSLNKPVP